MQGWLLWFALTAAFSLMGVGMASWQGELDVGAELGTAHIGVEFVEEYNIPGYKIITTPPAEWEGAGASIYCNTSKEIVIEVNNAYPGLEAKFWYEIENTGSLPLKIKDYKVTSAHSGVEVTGSSLPSVIAVNSTVPGEINIKITDVEPSDYYTFSVQISFEPGL